MYKVEFLNLFSNFQQELYEFQTKILSVNIGQIHRKTKKMYYYESNYVKLVKWGRATALILG